MLPKGLWSHNTRSGTTANALVPDSLTDLGGGACFNDARVEVERDAAAGAATAGDAYGEAADGEPADA
jgi:hypothetical protein